MTRRLFAALLSTAFVGLAWTTGCNAITGIDDFRSFPGEPLDDSLRADAESDALDAPEVDLDGRETTPPETDSTADEGKIDVPTTDSGIDGSGDAIDSGLVDSGTTDSGSDAPAVRRIFTTSETYPANLGGLVGADAKCQTLADAAKLGGTYRAWLSDSKTSAKSRLTHATVPYVLVDGTVVAADWADLVSGALSHAIDKTEKGTTAPDGGSYLGPKVVWTATETSGAFHSMIPFGASDSTCLDWTLSASEAADAGTLAGTTFGRWDSTGATWTQYGAASGTTCRAPTKIALYCLEQ